jgi:hypothetical protein
MDLLLQRDRLEADRTFGEMSADGRHLVHVLEDAVREVAGEPPELWKIHGKTAIPVGRYRVTLENSGRFGPDTLTLNNVKGFDAIRMHGGNTEKDTEGCPLLGMNRTAAGINNCAPAVAMVKELVRQAIAGGESVWLTVANP